jgi:hypothetical protein
MRTRTRTTIAFLAPGETHQFIAGLAKSLRAYTLEKPPSISEMNDVALAMELLGITRLAPEYTW